MDEVTKLKNYIIFNHSIAAVEKVNDSTVIIHLVSGHKIELKDNEALDYWEDWSSLSNRR